MKQVIQTVQS